MRKDNLKTGMRIVLNNNNTYILLLGNFKDTFDKLNEGILVNDSDFISFNHYTNDLKFMYNNELNIIKIYDLPNNTDILNIKTKGKLLWECKNKNNNEQ